MDYCGRLSMLAKQVANTCGDGVASMAEDADGNADAGDAADMFHAEPKPTGPTALVGNGNTVPCVEDGGAGAKPPLHIAPQ